MCSASFSISLEIFTREYQRILVLFPDLIRVPQRHSADALADASRMIGHSRLEWILCALGQACSAHNRRPIAERLTAPAVEDVRLLAVCDLLEAANKHNAPCGGHYDRGDPADVTQVTCDLKSSHDISI